MGISIKSLGVSLLILALVAVVVPSATAQAADGVFQSCYNITSNEVGINTINLQLLVSPQTRQVHGMTTLLPTDKHLGTDGVYYPAGKGAVAMLRAASGETGMIIRLQLPAGWGKPGVAMVQGVLDGKPFQVEGPASPCKTP